MRSSPALYPAVEILHIIGFVVLVGSILALDLRMLGLGRAIPIAPMAQLLLPMSRFGFLLAISMGFLLFSADASHVVRNPAFQTKLLLIAAALVNIVIAHRRPVAARCALGHAKPRRRQSHRAGVAAAVARRRLRRAPDRVYVTRFAAMRRIRFAILAIPARPLRRGGHRRRRRGRGLVRAARRPACRPDAACRCARRLRRPAGLQAR